MELNNSLSLHQKLIQLISLKCGTNAIAPALSDALRLNKSSVYERINGNKLFTLNELVVLVEYFDLHLDDLIHPKPGKITFQANSLVHPINNCQTYLKEMHQLISGFSAVPDLKVWFSTPSLPFFYHMFFRELALFKLFAYARINWQLSYTENLVFHPDTFPENYLYEQYMQPIASMYAGLSTIEFCADDLYYHTLRQISYFTESGQLTDHTVVNVLLEQLCALCNHQREMAKAGEKWVYGSRGGKRGKIDLYYNEISPATITLLLESSSVKGVFTVLDDPNFMYSDNVELYQYTHRWMQRLQAKCIKISENSERERRVYFNRLQSHIERDKRQI